MLPIPHVTKPCCFLIYALAPTGVSAAEANRQFNLFVDDRSLPLVLFHDHFIGQHGGVALFFVATAQERAALAQAEHLAGWQVAVHPLIFSYNPAAFDEQIAFTLRRYRDMDWEMLQRE